MSALFRGITSKHDGDFCCLNCFRSYTTENKLKKHKKVCENHDYCYVEMPEKDNKILKYNQGEKSMRFRLLFILDYYRGKNCMKNFCLDLREHVTKIINYEKKEMIPSTKEENKMHNQQKVCYICKEIFSTDDNNKKYHKVKDHCHYTKNYRGATT